MTRARRLFAFAVAGLLAWGIPASADATAPVLRSANVVPLANIPEMQTAISLGFIDDTLFVSTTLGLYSYDVSNPAAPKLLGALPMYLWENEDMTIDPVRHLAFLSRDSRGFTTHYVPVAVVPLGILHVIDVSNPADMRPIAAPVMPIGHTASCVESCRYIWTAGIVRGAPAEPARGSRAVWATDLTDPANPKICGPFDQGGTGTNNSDGSHDVHVDDAGIAWVSGDGGVWGYWTHGRHRDPRTGKIATATGCAPIPYAGGQSPASATPGRYMHNASRNLRLRAGRHAARGTVLFATEENITSSCSTSGRFAAYDLRGSQTGRAWRDKAYFMKVMDTWTPEGQEGSSGCASAHWFTDRGDATLAYAFYEQGTRILDASNPRNIRQVGWWRPNDADAWAAYWHKGVIFVADYNRGIDILSVGAGPGSATVVAPVVHRAPSLPGDPAFGYTCRIPPARVG